ncbi:hypothetical protein GF373_07835, partial [bacterium]|nr:hypothetical protein [bacterium]
MGDLSTLANKTGIPIAWQSLQGTQPKDGLFTVQGNGSNNLAWLSEPIEAKPGAYYEFSFWGRKTANIQGGLAVSGPTFANRDFTFGNEFQPYSFVFRVPDNQNQIQLRMGQWHVDGALQFKKPQLVPVQPIYTTNPPYTLGHGEHLGGDSYTASHEMNAKGANACRFLHSTNARFNSNRWLITADSAIEYRHRLPKPFASANVHINVNYHVRGQCVVEAQNARSAKWTPLGLLDEVNGGEETFVAFALAQDGKEWIPFFENPFLFYDHDRDGVTEEVLRLSGYNTQVESMRHSFDADNDATQDHPRDFDVSITTWAPGGNPKPAQNQRGRSTLTIPPRYINPISLRDIPCRGFLAHAHARHFVKSVTWDKLLLTWDEIDLNGDAENEYSDFDERWEGVIADGNQSFPQVGGPSGGPFNKRNELIAQSPAKTQLYYFPFDNRIHLKHAEQGWLDVDWNFDRAIDMRYTMRDTDQDGYIDRYEYDLNADGQIDDTWSIPGPAKNIHFTWPDISTIRKPINNTMVKKQHKQNAAMAAKIKSIDKKAWQRIQPNLPGLEKVKSLPPAVLHRLHTSHESKYYFTLLKRDYLICTLKQLQIPKTLHKNLNRLRDQAMNDQWRDILGLSPYLEIKPTHQKQKTLPALAWEMDKQSGTITWQTNKSTYRWRQGRFDFLKTQNKGKTRTITTPKEGAQEKQELLYTNPPGCGLTLYINQTPYPLWHAKNQNNLEFTYKTLSHTPKKATLEIRMENAGPKNQPRAVILQCTAFANREDLKIQARVECDRSQEPLSLGIGLSKLQQE